MGDNGHRDRKILTPLEFSQQQQATPPLLALQARVLTLEAQVKHLNNQLISLVDQINANNRQLRQLINHCFHNHQVLNDACLAKNLLTPDELAVQHKLLQAAYQAKLDALNAQQPDVQTADAVPTTDPP